MLDLWQWRTDAHHRLVLLKAPPGAATPSASAGDMLLWERFTDTDVPALRARHWSRRRCSQYNLTWAHTRAYAKGASEKMNSS